MHTHELIGTVAYYWWSFRRLPIEQIAIFAAALLVVFFAARRNREETR
jgi:hypothetical protein